MPPKTQLDRMEDRLNGIHDLIHGKGSEDPGMKTQLDRLVQNDARRSWLSRTTFGIALTALGTALAKAFHS